MKCLKRLALIVLGGLIVIALELGVYLYISQKGKRPAGPPEGVKVSFPFGAIDLDEIQTDPNSKFQKSIADSIRAETPADFDPDHDGEKEYDLLALSGGGSNGAYGAGLLCGWTARGDRPDFKVVTGVSAGALQATAAFLGSKYDYALREIYTLYDTDDIYTRRTVLAGIVRDSRNDSAPLRRIVEKYLTAEVLEAVAAAHARGKRLFLGTTNMDTGAFVIWDMGAIASSGRPDALEHYRNVLMASSAAQVIFPPVYFDVKADGETYSEMHADGATYAQVFFRGFLLDFDDALIDIGDPKVELRIFIVQNGKALEHQQRQNLEPKVIPIAARTIRYFFDTRSVATLYRVYVLAHRYEIDFNLGAIPQDFTPELDITDFNQTVMKKMFDTGYNQAVNGYPWLKVPPGLDKDEIIPSKSPATAEN